MTSFRVNPAHRIIGLGSVVALFWLLASWPHALLAGGSGLNVVVVVNTNSANSVELGNYFCEKRGVPPGNVLRIAWSGGNASWSTSQFQTNLANPLLNLLGNGGLSNQITYVALSMDIPFSVTNEYGANSTTAVLFYGFKGDIASDARAATNSYAASESSFVSNKPATAPGASFLATMLTAATLTQARQLVDQGVASDGTFPTQTVLLAKSNDGLRNIRHRAFDNAVFNVRVTGIGSIARINSNSPYGQTNLLGYQTGLPNYFVSPQTFVPGAMADSLTSFGGVIFGPNSQTSLLAFIHGGAAGSYGTVTEPQPVPDKFPDPQNYFYQARGFSLAECYYQSLTNPYQGLIVGEPLAAPFRHSLSGRWVGIETNAPLSGLTNLLLQFASESPTRPVQRVDLFVDDIFMQTVTNLMPRAGNTVSVALNNRVLNYVVPTNATLAEVASGLAAVLNDPTNTSITAVQAAVHGDRIELQSLHPQLVSGTYEFIHQVSDTNIVWQYHAMPQWPAVAASLRPLGFKPDGGFELSLEVPPGVAYAIQASANLKDWVTILSGSGDGPQRFTDPYARFYPRRFYRIGPALNLPRKAGLLALGKSANGAFRAYIEAAAGRQYVIEASTNLTSWIGIATNFLGGPMEFVDADAPRFARRFYRVGVSTHADWQHLKALGRDASGRFGLRVETAGNSAYVLQASADFTQWQDVFTNSQGGTINFADAASTNLARRFYRTRSFGTTTEPVVTLLGRTPAGDNHLRVKGAGQSSSVVFASSNNVDWIQVYSNLANGPIVTTVNSSTGVADQLTTFVSAARPIFLDSVARGVRRISLNGSLPVGMRLELQVTKTNANLVTIAVTNQSPGGNWFQFAQQLTNQINSAVALQGDDGVVAEDLSLGFLGASHFGLYARSGGFGAAGIRVSLTSPNAGLSGSLTNADLRENHHDLLPRNHLYLASGLTNLPLTVTLDTTALPDGYHELTAVAYEGTHVQTQSRCSLPVKIQNSSILATLTITGAGGAAPVQTNLQARVVASGAAVGNISLFSTGGLLGSVTNQNSADFTIGGNLLGAGLHSFYAVVTTTNGYNYRTATTRVRLVH